MQTCISQAMYTILESFCEVVFQLLPNCANSSHISIVPKTIYPDGHANNYFSEYGQLRDSMIPAASLDMSFQVLTQNIKQCLGPASRTRLSLANALQQLLNGIKAQKKGRLDPESLLVSMIPVIAHVLLSPGISDSERDLALECLLETLTPEKARPDDWNLYGVLTHAIDGLQRTLLPLIYIETSEPTLAIPEHTRLLALKCWRRLFTQIKTVHIPPMYKSELVPADVSGSRPRVVSIGDFAQTYWPPLFTSKVVAGLLDNAELGADQNLRLTALDTLIDCCNVGLFGGADQLRHIFPGIVSTMTWIAVARQHISSSSKADDQFTNDMRQPPLAENTYRKPPAVVRARAIDVMKIIVSIVYGNPQQQSPGDYTEMEGLASQARTSGLASIIQSKDGENGDVSKDSDEKMSFLRIVRLLTDLRHTEHTAIAKALETLFAEIVLNCANTLSIQVFASAVEASLILAITHEPSGDRSPTIDRIASKCQADASDSMYRRRIGKFAESCFGLFDQYVAGNPESRRRDVLCLMTGYMRVLGPSDSQSLMLPWWTTSGALSLIASLAISLPGTSLLISDVSGTDGSSKPIDYVLGYYRTPELRFALDKFVAQAIETFTMHGLQTMLVGFLDTQPADVHPQILWLLSRVPSTDMGEGKSIGCQPVIDYVVDYFSQSPPIDDDKTSDSIRVVGAAGQDVLQSCMVLNTVSSVVSGIGASVAYYMDSLLFPLLETTTSQSPVVREQARQALSVLAHTWGAVSVPDMLRDNIDYIVEGCSRQLRTVDLHPKVFNILIGCVDLVGEGVLVYMDDVVEDTLDVCESWMDDDRMATSALRFMEVVTRTISLSQPPPDQDTRKLLDNGQRTTPMRSMDPIGDAMDELQKLEDFEQLFAFTTIGDDDDNDADQSALGKYKDISVVRDTEDGEPGNPLAIKITLVAQNFLSRNGAQQLVSLKILQNTLLALRNSRDLLPLINQVWPALKYRLDKGRDDHYVILAACDVADTVCSVGSDWMRQRVREDLWVRFRQILMDTSRESLRRMPSECELVRRVICTLTTVVRVVPLDDAVAWDLIWLALRVIDNSVLEPFVIVLLNEMMPVYGDKVWLILSKLGRTATSPKDIPNLDIPLRDIRAPSNIAVLLGIS